MKNQKVRLTQKVVDAAAPADGEYMMHDTAIAGFALRVRPSGAKSFVFRYRTAGGRRGKVRRVTIAGDRAEPARA